MDQGKRFAAVDTTFLFALHGGDEDCEEVVDWLTSNNIYILITSCVIQEVVDMVDKGEDEEIKRQAGEVLSCIPIWGFLPSAPFDGIKNGIAHIIAEKILASGVISSQEINDALTVVEAASDDCVILLTLRKSIVEASYDHLKLALLESHVPDVLVSTPADIVKFLRHRQEQQAEEGE